MMVLNQQRSAANRLLCIALEKDFGLKKFSQISNQDSILTTFKLNSNCNLGLILLGLPENNDDALLSLPKSDLVICTFGEIKYKRRKSEYIRFYCDYDLSWYIYFINDGIDTVESSYGMLLQKGVITC